MMSKTGNQPRIPGLARGRLLWICSIIGLSAGALIVWMFDLNWWTAATFIVLIACPVVIAWVLAIARRQNPFAGKKS